MLDDALGEAKVVPPFPPPAKTTIHLPLTIHTRTIAAHHSITAVTITLAC